MGATIVDALDTLKIMGLDEEFKQGRDWVADHLSFNVVSIYVCVSVCVCVCVCLSVSVCVSVGSALPTHTRTLSLCGWLVLCCGNYHLIPPNPTLHVLFLLPPTSERGRVCV